MDFTVSRCPRWIRFYAQLLGALLASASGVGLAAARPIDTSPAGRGPSMVESSAILVAEPYLVAGAMDSTNGFAYYGDPWGYVVKVRFSDFTRVAGLSIPGYGSSTLRAAVIDEAAGMGYFATDTSPAKIAKVRLSDLTFVGDLTLAAGENYVRSAAIDPSGGYAYFGLSSNPGKIVKVRLADFTEVGSLTLSEGEGWLYAAGIDPVAGFAYFGTYTAPARVVKVRLSDFSRVGALTLNADENDMSTIAVDATGGFAYVSTAKTPTSVVKIRLADFTRIGASPIVTYLGHLGQYPLGIDPVADRGYVTSDEIPAKVRKYRLSDLALLETITFRSGENSGTSVLVDGPGGYAYVGTWTTPGMVVRVDLGNTATSLTATPNPSNLGDAVALDAHVTSVTTTAIPTGTVAFAVDGSVVPGCSAVALDAQGHAVCTTSALSAGTHAAIATFGGDGSFNPSAGSADGLVVNIVVAVSAPATICAGSTGGTASVADFGSGASYSWTVANGSITAGAGTREVAFTAGSGGPVSLTATVDVGGTSASGSAEVTVLESPVVNITAPSWACAASAGNVATVAESGTDASYTWTVTNGTITSGQGTRAVEFRAGAAGESTVSVEIRNGSGCSASGTKVVTIHPEPAATIDAPGSVCANASGLTASVPDAGAGATYLWTITNGTIDSGASSRTVTFSAGAAGPVELRATVRAEAGCTANGTASVLVNAMPSAQMSAPVSVCANASGQTASVPDAGAGATYLWTITNGTIDSGASSRTVTFSAGAAGPVELRVTVRTEAGCTANGTASVLVNAMPSAQVSAPVSACANASGLTASVPDAGAGATYLWTITNGTINSGASSRTIAFSAGAAGPVELRVTIRTEAGCTANGTANVLVNPIPSGQLSAPVSVCANASGLTASVPDAGAGATYIWTITNGTIDSGASSRTIAFSAGAAGPVELRVTVRTEAGCSASGTASVLVNPIPSGQLSAPLSVCSNASGLTASVPDAGAGATYIWTVSNATITSGSGTRSITFAVGSTGPVTLAVLVRSAGGCSAGGSQTVNVNTPASAEISAPSAVCASSTGNAASVPDAGAGASYLWAATNATITGGAGTRSVSFAASTTGPVNLAVTIVTAAGCSSAGSRSVAVNAIPSATITAPAQVKRGASATATVPDAGAGTTYAWTITNGTITSGAGTRSVRFKAGSRGTLVLRSAVTSSTGCGSTATKNVTVY